ncbi:MAG: hypothetical protein V1838_01990 [Patescibacteria group bacterium]
MKSTKFDILVELHVPSFSPVKTFYGMLGFKKVWERPPKKRQGYLVMRRGQSILGFYCGNNEVYQHSYFKKYPKRTVRSYGVELAIPVLGIESYYKKLCTKLPNKYFVQPLKMKAWGNKDFRLVDPFGFYLRINEPINILKKPKYTKNKKG